MKCSSLSHGLASIFPSGRLAVNAPFLPEALKQISPFLPACLCFAVTSIVQIKSRRQRSAAFYCLAAGNSKVRY
ncbi:hypothetical protein CHCC20335_1682 [Bacillus paralicheniformis]|nr:hypothetical protein CHCC20335_1682 [Bacillus paralicheniformis]